MYIVIKYGSGGSRRFKSAIEYPESLWIQTASGSRQPLDPYSLWIQTASGFRQPLDSYSLWIQTASGFRQPLDPDSL
jgi:hypothetical protein